MLTFNDVLQVEGIDPKTVQLVRHQDKRAGTLDAYLTGAADGKVVPLRTGAHPGAHLAHIAQSRGM
jgi:hypothetical protein